jgi:DNA-binding transcriptional LysR family regulator
MGDMTRAGDIDWNDLRYFLAAARSKTLAGAARALGVEHSTIGRRLTALEETLGVSLLTRGPDGLVLTGLGDKLVPPLEEMERAVLAVMELTTSRKTRVRLATPTGFASLISPHLAAFQAAHPSITLELLSSSRRVDLRKSEADLAIRLGASDDEDLVARKIADAGWSLYAASAYLARHPAPADPGALAGHDVLGFEASLAGVPGAKWIEAHGQGANIIMRCRELMDMVAACVAGLGLAVLPCMAAVREPALQRLTPAVLGTHRLSLVYRKEVLVAEPVKAVIQFVMKIMSEQAAGMSGEGG